MPATPPPDLCVFDLDGTLVDSLDDIAEALNECLELLGVPGHPVPHYRYMVGEGVPRLCQRAIGDEHPHLVARLIELARPRYRARVVRHTRPYPGIPDAVRDFAAAGIPLAVLSNKPHELTRLVVNRFWDEGTFVRVQGYVEERGRKPDPGLLLRICREAGVAPARTWMIGDTPTDIETARRAGCTGVGVAWGFRPVADLRAAGADLVVETPGDLATAAGLPGGADGVAGK